MKMKTKKGTPKTIKKENFIKNSLFFLYEYFMDVYVLWTKQQKFSSCTSGTRNTHTRSNSVMYTLLVLHTHKLHSLFSTFKRLTENIFLQMPTQTCGCVSNEWMILFFWQNLASVVYIFIYKWSPQPFCFLVSWSLFYNYNSIQFTGVCGDNWQRTLQWCTTKRPSWKEDTDGTTRHNKRGSI